MTPINPNMHSFLYKGNIGKKVDSFDISCSANSPLFIIEREILFGISKEEFITYIVKWNAVQRND